MDHLLIHCKFAHALWSEVFLLFEVLWVVLNTIYSSNVWNRVPACLMWLIWKNAIPKHLTILRDLLIY